MISGSVPYQRLSCNLSVNTLSCSDVFITMRRNVRRFHGLLLLLVFSFVPNLLSAELVYQEDESWSLDLPEGMILDSIDAEAQYTAFSSPDGSMAIQVFHLGKDGDSDPVRANERIRTAMKAGLADAGISTFLWNGKKVCLADMSWQMGTGNFRGYFMTVESDQASQAVLVGSTVDTWPRNQAWLISTLDSLGLTQDDWILPGPISTALDGPKQEDSIQANQDLIEREALILSQYQKAPREIQIKAWTRFYRVIYRDSFSRLAESAQVVRNQLLKEKIPIKDHPSHLAAWIQNFTYERPGSLSDLRSPLASIVTKTGDCDARGLVFMIMLRHWGIANIMMVSSVHQHSLVGVNLAGEGAKFNFEGTEWLITELTAKVPLGQIEQKMAKSADWIGMNLEYDPWAEQ